MNAMTITKPELVYGMSDEIYHGDPVPDGSLSSTFARLLTNHVPIKAEARRRNRRPTRAMNLGKAAHAHALGAGPKLIVWEHDGRTKSGKEERAAAEALIASEAAVAVKADERDRIEGMIEALLANKEVADLFAASKAEVSGFWQESGIWCRARYDMLGDLRADDYKTCEDATSRGFSKAMGAYGYHQQAEFYQRGLRALGHPAGKRVMRFICQETEFPFLVQIHTPDQEAMDVARELNDRAIGIYAEAKKTGVWPGFPTLTPDPTPLPNWYWFAHGEDLSDAHNPNLVELTL